MPRWALSSISVGTLWPLCPFLQYTHRLIALSHTISKFHKERDAFTQQFTSALAWCPPVALHVVCPWHLCSFPTTPGISSLSCPLSLQHLTPFPLLCLFLWTIKPAFFSQPSSYLSSLISLSQTSVKDHLHEFSPFLHSHSWWPFLLLHGNHWTKGPSLIVVSLLFPYTGLS